MLGILRFSGTPDLASTVFVAAIAIAILGVPHGGLDHWTGRRLLSRQFPHRWWLVFFPAYLLIGLLFGIGWFLFPMTTVILFFLISAWHFGREDQQTVASRIASARLSSAQDHLAATSVGGLVIWIPSLVRPDEMQRLLCLIVPATKSEAVVSIVGATQIIAVCLVPLAICIVVHRLFTTPASSLAWVPLATSSISIYAPILISFSIYFCGWHSWQGLQRLRRNESLTTYDFIRSVAPLSVAAVLGIVSTRWWLRAWPVELISSGQTSATLQTLFIGLSAIAVPHLLLHEFDSRLARYRSNPQELV
jgi:beta-carotene 15,15'-dioxygenase